MKRALDIEAGLAEGRLHAFGREPRIEADAAVAPPLDSRKDRVPAGRLAGRVGNLLGQRTDLLHAQDVGVRTRQDVREPLLHAGPDPLTFQLTTRIGCSPAPATGLRLCDRVGR